RIGDGVPTSKGAQVGAHRADGRLGGVAVVTEFTGAGHRATIATSAVSVVTLFSALDQTVTTNGVLDVDVVVGDAGASRPRSDVGVNGLVAISGVGQHYRSE